MGPVKRRLPRYRQAFTMVELVIVLAIVVILAAVGIGQMTDLLPRFRARKAANQLAADISRARMMAMMHNKEAKFEVTDWDTSFTDVDSPAYGSWEISVGNKTSSSTCWDVLPVDDGGCVDTYQTEGVRDISADGEDFARFVGLATPTVFEISFNPRGWVSNDAGDLQQGAENGYIEYLIYNKASASKGLTQDNYSVRVYRSGMVRVESNMNDNAFENDAGGTEMRSTLPQ